MAVPSYDRKDSKTQYMVDIKKLLDTLMKIIYKYPSKYRNALTDSMVQELEQCIMLSYRANGITLTSQKAKGVSISQYNVRRDCLNEIMARILTCNTMFDIYVQAIYINDSKEATRTEILHEYEQSLKRQNKELGIDTTQDEFNCEVERLIRKAQTRRGKRLHQLFKTKEEVGELTSNIIKNIQDIKKRDNDLKKYIKEDETVVLLKEILSVLNKQGISP